MSNAISFGASFLSYLLVFAVFVVTVVAAVLIGVAIAKNIQKKKEEQQKMQNGDEEYPDSGASDPIRIE